MISINLQGVQFVNNALQHLPRQAELATKNAVKNAVRTGLIKAVESVKSRYALKSISDFTGSLSAQSSGLSGQIVAKGQLLSLRKFAVNPRRRINQRGKYIKAEVLKGVQKQLQTAFWAFGNKTLFQRQGTRTDLKSLKGPAPAEMLNKVKDPVVQSIEKVLSQTFRM